MINIVVSVFGSMFGVRTGRFMAIGISVYVVGLAIGSRGPLILSLNECCQSLLDWLLYRSLATRSMRLAIWQLGDRVDTIGRKLLLNSNESETLREQAVMKLSQRCAPGIEEALDNLEARSDTSSELRALTRLAKAEHSRLYRSVAAGE